MQDKKFIIYSINLAIFVENMWVKIEKHFNSLILVKIDIIVNAY